MENFEEKQKEKKLKTFMEQRSFRKSVGYNKEDKVF